MGKKRSQKDRGYITAKEHAEEWGGFKDRSRGAPFARLPFNCCAITFTPFEDPVCTDDGIIYDIVAVVPYVRKFGRHPVKGTPLALGDLIHLNFHKNADGEYACPVTGKVFTDHTHIVAVKPTGNVYAWEAVEELNIKAKNWRDLVTEEPFTRKDIMHLQDPLNLSGRLIQEFDHVRKVGG
ncbi:peptidyl-prolyl cis-trans isomerase-like2 [Monoraphidium neglectum]|uniref:RING-type E3 ubiquitin transferase n=1 Tax=Monoraphidium neglectum TaxID=145388 RepID=A0A0D2MA03_9CHLO|nr:peptidyl-prolyl cis-trans isomerase-like2 [Monoraphidium neglectum]KIY92185.1 peptidyl-prolyl cis-trans isomerase-like2 [Monoraphidium neglectum]|eukprot:XP_013891205.1 peptidyl-prolyl cis-trans isomerase-like2 [Monoraphidium neglectum]